MNLEELKSRFGFCEPDRGLDKEGDTHYLLTFSSKKLDHFTTEKKVILSVQCSIFFSIPLKLSSKIDIARFLVSKSLTILKLKKEFLIYEMLYQYSLEIFWLNLNFRIIPKILDNFDVKIS